MSRLCKLMDEQVFESDKLVGRKGRAWTKDGCLEAFEGTEIPYVLGDRPIEMAMMFGFVRRSGNLVAVANRIFETLLYNYFLMPSKTQQEEICDEALKDKNLFVQDGRLDMRLVLEKFVLHFNELYGEQGQTFYEEEGRRFFLLYLRPIINETGHYYVEAQTRNRERTDVIVDYGGEQFIVELKIWRGDAYHSRGEKQISDYLDHYHLKKGYMLSFNFNKNYKGIK